MRYILSGSSTQDEYEYGIFRPTVWDKKAKPWEYVLDRPLFMARIQISQLLLQDNGCGVKRQCFKDEIANKLSVAPTMKLRHSILILDEDKKVTTFFPNLVANAT